MRSAATVETEETAVVDWAVPRRFWVVAVAAIACSVAVVAVWSMLVETNVADRMARETCRVQADRSWPSNPDERQSYVEACLRSLPE